jgi:RNA ligase
MNGTFIKNLEKHYKEGWLIKQTHPKLPLTIWNYSQKTQFERFWNSITLSCRGLVTDDDGRIVARPFKKFFNIEQHDQLPSLDFEVFEKMDGSLGILFYYVNEWIIASRGSFTSDQAIKAKELLSKYPLNKLDKNKTYCFEIIY